MFEHDHAIISLNRSKSNEELYRENPKVTDTVQAEASIERSSEAEQVMKDQPKYMDIQLVMKMFKELKKEISEWKTDEKNHKEASRSEREKDIEEMENSERRSVAISNKMTF